MLLENTWYFQRDAVGGIFLSTRGNGERGRVQRGDFSPWISELVHMRQIKQTTNATLYSNSPDENVRC